MAPGTAVAETQMPVNGTGMALEQATQTDQNNKQQFYKNLFRLQDDVFAGKHPRIKLPADFFKQLQAVSSAPNPTAPQALPNGKVTNTAGTVPAVTFGSPSALNPRVQQSRPVTSTSKPPTSSASSFDPILLTKSDELIRAEIVLKRQRLEQALEERVAKAYKPAKGFRFNDTNGELEVPLDVDALLNRALEVIKPVSGLPDEEGSEKESFDENDYYSSQAMSWSTEDTPEGAEPSTSVQFPTDTAPAAQAAGPAKSFIPGITQALQPPEPVAAGPRYTGNYDELPDEDDEDDYSPPPPDAAPVAQPTYEEPAATTSNDRLRPQQAYDRRYEYNRPSPPAANVPVIRSHIREPFAPQPSRVSPLALGKLPALDQARVPPQSQAQVIEDSGPEISTRNEDNNRSGNTTNSTPRQTSPEPPLTKKQLKMVKKRKRQERAEVEEKQVEPKRSLRKNPSRAARGRQAAASPSPVPFIKDEPVSPPPFAESSFAEALPPRRRIVQYPYEDVEVISPREWRARPAYHRDEYDRPVYRYAEPVSPTYVRVASPSMARRVERDDVDLRRVASLQYARRPYSPGPGASQYAAAAYDRIAVEPQRSVRAASYAYERGAAPALEPIYREGSIRPQRYLRERSRSPPYIVERAPAYPVARADRVASPGPSMMPPPPVPTRIIEDKHGNRYYATPAPPDAPPGPIRPQSRAMFYEREAPVPVYERAISRMSMARDRPPPQRVYDDEMPPPPVPMLPQRRYVEDVEAVEHRAYRQREYSMRPPEYLTRETVRDRERDREEMPPPPRVPLPEAVEGRQLIRYDDESSPRAPPRELAPPMPIPPARAYSVRPDPGRREVYGDEMGRGIVRRGTAQPQVFVQNYPLDDGPAPVPMGQVRRSRRYVDDEEFDEYAGGRRGDYRL
ncbi:hypothetical protein NA57DRAFT_73098 [Rhizodiscina lignyota]|uniref:Uncharacterized protein n=1 Tax=Rhizodiscina lignyota TaxID=1504668 RepID=A0A9P4IKI5_9PEZI|nr:hypothetical protein NA57DRAFT_73098 [Rhizodiscina lignyota]